MRLVFAGTPEVALPSLRALIGSDRHEVAAVVTRPDAPSGRGRTLHRSPVGALADEHGIEVLTPAKASDPVFQARLREIAPDACPVVAYGALLPQSALDIPVHGWINLHFSVLPAWRGAAPVQATVRSGDEFAGASTFRIVKALDAGPVFGVLTDPVRPDDTAGVLLDRLAESGAGLLLATLDGIEDGSLTAVEQPADGVSHAPKITVEDAKVDFALPGMAVDRLVRSVTPEPGAWAEFRGERIKLGPVTRDAVEAELKPGELLVERKRVLVGTATWPVRLGEVQAQGKKRMRATDWARGTRIEAGERLT
ncbi:Methionyl-tRNA formyltransferase [Actinokineospora spheciospongiae]|uniref:Methionyl-tRNA formyltransferase n=1 Tax=Actinokineospora spheciospongiae TaxID=909613 RepID=W7J1C3_9PSEU|nr:methionyl-tRNA formyltransferase [Actinokineospora spheciospongiae]EWC62711.1 Methionyl-tRNA formyltransferase [Actinokineospora spheciospongiae]PWW54142.1 methionyl-tRNA formyltransferase [Actinokineospora spheciospongiae]